MPRDLVVNGGRGEHVKVPVPIEVRRVDRLGPVGRRRDHLLGAKLPAPLVLMPRNLVVTKDAESTSWSPSPSRSAA